tara:strand:- start:292 stop:552 length:261 start_codon:yes stop_codon:yes gene_type:complete
MLYRDIKYEFKEWTTYQGEIASSFTCSDKKLLKNVSDYVEMATSTQDEMFERIDYYLDNKAKLTMLEKIKKHAVGVFYETLNYKGD